MAEGNTKFSELIRKLFLINNLVFDKNVDLQCFIEKEMLKIELLKSKLLPDFPSGSSINYKDHKFYLIGDDATGILILDKDYNQIGSGQLFQGKEKRIPKPIKSDLESSCFAKIDGKDVLIVIGSGSTPERNKVFIIPYVESGLDIAHFRVINDEGFIAHLKSTDIKDVNLEGSTVMGDFLILSNRGNMKHPTNHLLVTDFTFLSGDVNSNLKIIPVKFPDKKAVVGISELCYSDSDDILFMSLSSESTDNTYDDGEIGDSYIGWIKDASKRLEDAVVIIDQIINLSPIHQVFRSQKIEGLCIESINDNRYILHLISDNDQGESRLFKISLIL